MNWQFPYRSQRMPLLADNVVAASQPLAAQAGVSMLAQGGNAVDAAIACAATLTVVEPVMNGLGSDAFVQVWDGATVHTLNGSGRAPAAWHPDDHAGRASMPREGWAAVTVPGAVSAWIALWRRFGRLPLARLFAPAIAYARDGFAVSPIIARQWASQVVRLRSQPGFAQAFLPQGRAPLAGERFRHPAIARALELIAATEGQAFYSGEIAAALVAHAKAHGGALSMRDLETHQADWVDPLTQTYRGLDVLEPPPNNQGLAVLIALGVLDRFDLSPGSADDATRMHLQIEAMKIGFADVYRWLADPASMPIRPEAMLEPAYLEARAAAIDPMRARAWAPCALPGGNTVYLASGDRDGMLVSFIQSNFEGFGAGVVEPTYGVSLLNRGAGFSLLPDHPNRLAGGKRPFHTIIPALLMRAHRAVGALGVVGADMQPQGQVQVIAQLEDLDVNPQSALDAPRWRVTEEGRIRLEADIPAAVGEALRARGHDVEVRPRDSLEFGGGQLVWRMADGWAAASDPRRDGCAAGF